MMATSTTDEDLEAAFAAHADEALAVAQQAFSATTEAWGCIDAYSWGESVGADCHGVLVPLNVGTRWVADLVMPHDQARELAEQIFDLTNRTDPDEC